ncbi:MAG: TVP38/TMEM64 family protein [Verrucomicrobia bacterium]|nr:TVP38/TMEM64 family protein [Verrucomicrobiota bacterium]
MGAYSPTRIHDLRMSPDLGSVGTETGSQTLIRRVLAVVVVGVLLVLLGRWLGHELRIWESWIAAFGWMGRIAFVGLMVLGTSVFLPNSVFTLLAGLLFGLLEGCVLASIGTLAAAVVDFLLSRFLLRSVIQDWLGRRPKLAALERVIVREGGRLVALVRLSPLSPVWISYLLGTTRLPVRTFLATSLCLLPMVWVEVYLGYVAAHVARMGSGRHPDRLHDPQLILSAIGASVGIGVMIWIGRRALRAIADAERTES